MEKKIIFAIIGAVVSFLIASIFAGRSAGEQGIMHSIIFSLLGFRVHLHHWLISLIALVFLIVIDRKFKIRNRKLFFILIGILAGLIIQGIIMYSDWYKVVYS